MFSHDSESKAASRDLTPSACHVKYRLAIARMHWPPWSDVDSKDGAYQPHEHSRLVHRLPFVSRSQQPVLIEVEDIARLLRNQGLSQGTWPEE